MGHLILATTSSTKATTSSSNYLPILLIIIVMVVIYWTMSRRSKQRQAAQMGTTLVPGQPVRTTSGMYGTISSVEGDDVLVEVHPGVHVRMMKRAVVPVPGGGPTMNGSAPTADAATNGASADAGDVDEPEDEPADEAADQPADETTDQTGDEDDSAADEASAEELSPEDRKA